MNGICIATVSKINYAKGTVDVIFPDRDNCTSSGLSVMDSEYNLPSVGDQVLVAFLTNDNSSGFVIGKFYNEKNIPKHSGKGLIFKELVNGDYIKAADGLVEIHVNKMIIDGDMEISGNLTVNGNLSVSGTITN